MKILSCKKTNRSKKGTKLIKKVTTSEAIDNNKFATDDLINTKLIYFLSQCPCKQARERKSNISQDIINLSSTKSLQVLIDSKK